MSLTLRPPVAPLARASSPYAARVTAELRVFAGWLAANGARGVVGEYGWPYDEAPAAWNALGASYLSEAQRLGLPTFWYATAQMYFNYKLAVYQPLTTNGDINQARPQAAVLQRVRSVGTTWHGLFVNDAGQNAPYQDEPTSSFSNANPGVFNTAYRYTNRASFTYVRARGVDTVILAFRWERLQPTLGAAFSATELGRFQAYVADALDAGLAVILQPFNKGAYYLDAAGTGQRHYIGDATVTQAHFNNLWSRLSALYKTEPRVIAYALMNEPMHPDPAAWEAVCQATVTAIRAIPDTKTVIVPMSQLGNLPSIGSVHPVGFVSDPNVLYEAHHYFDLPNPSGEYLSTYDAEAVRSVGPRLADAFNRANASSLGTADTGQVWNSDQTRIVSNQLASNNPTADSTANLNLYYPFGTLQATFAAVDPTGEMWLARRALTQSGPYPYGWQIGAAYGSWVVRSLNVGGGQTEVYTSAGAPAPAAGDVVTVRFLLGHLRFAVNGTVLHTRNNLDVGRGCDWGVMTWANPLGRLDTFSVTPDYNGG